MNIIEPSKSAIFPDLEGCEVTYAKDQPEYNPLRTLTDGTTVISRWSPTPEQRAAIMAGEDLFLELVTFGGPLQPIRLSIGLSVDEAKLILGLA